MSQQTDDMIHSPQTRMPERGFSLISAIFLLVVIAALAAFSVTLSTTQQQSAALDALGGRAYQAARAGMEWGTFQITQSGVVGGGVATDCKNNEPNTITPALQPTLPAGTQLSVFGVGVTCSAASHIDNIDGVTVTWVYELTSTASGVNGATPGSPDYVERKMRVTIVQ
jgi:MSHA biogenesis protein MshP